MKNILLFTQKVIQFYLSLLRKKNDKKDKKSEEKPKTSGSDFVCKTLLFYIKCLVSFFFYKKSCVFGFRKERFIILLIFHGGSGFKFFLFTLYLIIQRFLCFCIINKLWWFFDKTQSKQMSVKVLGHWNIFYNSD